MHGVSRCFSTILVQSSLSATYYRQQFAAIGNRPLDTLRICGYRSPRTPTPTEEIHDGFYSGFENTRNLQVFERRCVAKRKHSTRTKPTRRLCQYRREF